MSSRPGIGSGRHCLYEAHTESTHEQFDGDVVNPLCSLSKLISATVIVMLRDQGLLDYDVPVAENIPEFTGGGKNSITIRHLLTHSAGLPRVPLGPVDDEQQ